MTDLSQLSDEELDSMLIERGLPVSPSPSESPGLLDRLDVAAQFAIPAYGYARREPDMARKLVQGLTFNLGDEAEAALRSLPSVVSGEDFSDTYEGELSDVRGSLRQAEERSPVGAFITEAVGGAALPLGMIGKGAGWLKTLLAGGADAAVSGFGAGEEDVGERSSLALRSAALSPVLSVGGKALTKLGGATQDAARGFATSSEMKSIGLGKRAVGKAARKNKAATKRALQEGRELPFTETALGAKSAGILEPGQSVAKRVEELGLEKIGAAQDIDLAIKTVDDALGNSVRVDLSDFGETWRYLSRLPEDTPAFQKAAENIKEYLEPVISNINKEGTVGKVVDQKRKLYGIGYLSQSPTVKQLEKAIGRDLKKISERRIAAAAQRGLIPEEAVERFASGNIRYGQLEELQNAYVDDAAASLPQDALEGLVAQIRTSGGAGVAMLATGDPIYAALLAGGRTETGQDLLGKALRGVEGVTDIVEPITSPIASRGRAGFTAQQILDTEGSSDATEPREVSEISDERLDRMLRDRGLLEGDVDDDKKKDLDRGFVEKTSQIAQSLGADPRHLLAVMNFETGGTFDPAEKNRAGSGATGLIQFMPTTAKQLTGADSKEAAIALMESMSPTEQLDYVGKYLEPFKGKLDTLDDVYMAVLWPAAVGRDPNYVLFKEGTKAYWQNRGLDLNEDGRITKEEAANRVKKYLV